MRDWTVWKVLPFEMPLTCDVHQLAAFVKHTDSDIDFGTETITKQISILFLALLMSKTIYFYVKHCHVYIYYYNQKNLCHSTLCISGEFYVLLLFYCCSVHLQGVLLSARVN